MPIEMRSRFVKLDGHRTHYTESGGDGPVIVALHGGGAGSSGKAGMAPLMQALPPVYRVVALDSVGGFGLTDVDAPADYGLQSRVEHLEVFADALCLDRLTLLGNSQGAWVAARYAILHPDRVERLVMIGSATLGLAMGFPEEPTPAMLALLNYDGSRDGMRRLLEGLVYNKAIITEDLVEMRFASASRPGAMEAFKAAGKGNRYIQTDPVLRTQFDMRQSLPAVTKAIPSIVIWGENDNFAPVTLGRKLEPLLREAKFHYVAQAGHQVQNDQPTAVGDIVAAFMKAKPAGGSG
jgi:pimeloyl-ACP methyl ester carboxylesterase